ncbi:MAG TPA: glycosyltransferase family 2 protein [Verrucomicrobiae bacterium]|nr:glycosyltransferase family 2 protein [Verrucomicrobiae bacterium]
MIERKITVGIPTFNEEKNILKFFESLQKQNNNETNKIEKIIFIDDSSDNTPNLIQEFKKKNPLLNIELIHNANRKGASNAWNIIFKKSIGDVVILLDADITLEKNCIANLCNKIDQNTGLCASNTVPIIEENNIFSRASGFIAFWLRSIRMHGISQYTTMGRALAVYTQDVKDLEIPNNIIAIDLYLQCKIMEKRKNVVYNDNAIIYFKTPLNLDDFLSQVTRAIIGHKQIKEYTKKFSIDISTSMALKEFIKNAIKYPKYCLALIYCYSRLPFSYLKHRKKVSYLWETATSTKE